MRKKTPEDTAIEILREGGDGQQAQMDTALADAPAYVFGVTACKTSWEKGEPRQTSLQSGSALADEEHRNGQPITPETIFGVGSVTKMFTAATLLRMTEHPKFKEQFGYVETPSGNLPAKGKSGIDTPLSHFTPALKEHYRDSTFIQSIEDQDHFEDITLRHLLQHTSGIATNTTQEFFEDISKNPSKEWSSSEILDTRYMKGNKGFGTFDYSNSGYTLLGMIIETAGSQALKERKSYSDLVTDLVIEPLGLENTRTHETIGDITPDKKVAQGKWVDEKGTLHETMQASYAYGAGGMLSTPTDINKFTRAFLTTNPDHSLFEDMETLRSIKDSRTKSKVTVDNKDYHWGLGFRVEESGLAGHNGNIIGYGSDALYDPKKDESFSVAIVKQDITTGLRATLKQAALEHLQADNALEGKDESATKEAIEKKFGEMADNQSPQKLLGELLQTKSRGRPAPDLAGSAATQPSSEKERMAQLLKGSEFKAARAELADAGVKAAADDRPSTPPPRSHDIKTPTPDFPR